MDRAKLRQQTQKLRNKRVVQKTRLVAPKIKKGVVKLQSFSSKKTAPAAPPPSNTKVIKKSPAQHAQIISTAGTRHKAGGCGGCKRKLGR